MQNACENSTFFYCYSQLFLHSTVQTSLGIPSAHANLRKERKFMHTQSHTIYKKLYFKLWKATLAMLLFFIVGASPVVYIPPGNIPPGPKELHSILRPVRFIVYFI